MVSYLIRLDDACPTMNHENWNRVEALLDYYKIKPIVGIIPDNKDLDFAWHTDENFWDKALNWQAKGWTIAQHGFTHQLHNHQRGSDYFQLSHSVNTEFAGVNKEQQRQMLFEGNKLLRQKGISPTCFFAPAHTYDANTVAICCEIPDFEFISDGYALRPYKKSNMVFIPSICDGPITTPSFGIYTFVFHPSVMDETAFLRLEDFLKQRYEKIKSPLDIFGHYKQIKEQGFIGLLLEYMIFIARRIRGGVK